MQAITYSKYGSVDVLRQKEVAAPSPGKNDVLVSVRAASVTTADARLRSSDFPGIMWLPGRAMFGLFGPRKPVLGMEFAGQVAAVGTEVTEFRPGDRVFGFSGGGAHAEQVLVPANGAIVKTPSDMTDEDAVALPFGGLSALVFLRDFAGLKPGQRILVVGGSGGVGVYGVQIAKALGAHVTAVSSAPNADLVTSLGADRWLNYADGDFLTGEARYDVIFDTVGALGFEQAKPALTRTGVFLPLNFSGREMVQAMTSGFKGGPRIHLGVSGDKKSDLIALLDLVQEGALRPVVDRVYPIADVAAAYRYVEARHRKGAVIIDMLPFQKERLMQSA